MKLALILQQSLRRWGVSKRYAGREGLSAGNRVYIYRPARVLVRADQELDSIQIKSSMPNRPIYAHRFVASLWKKFNFNLRAQRQIRYGKQAHPHIAQIDAKSIHLGRPGEYLHRGVQQLALPTTPVFEVGLEHDQGNREGKGIAMALVGEDYGGSVHYEGDMNNCRNQAITFIHPVIDRATQTA